MLLVCHLLAAGPGAAAALLADAHRAAGLLSTQPGCHGVELGCSVDEPEHWVLTARFDSVPAYRRALSPFDVREHVVPLLARAQEGAVPRPSTFEVRLVAVAGAVTEHAGDRADDGAAGAAGPAAPRPGRRPAGRGAADG